tara:strand:+ start:16678 stop:16980 length:303 start_codon:yes stop_codon:yes gene_type:complete
MAKKTFKIGEYCKGGILSVETTSKTATVIAKDWDFSQGSRRGSNQSNAKEFDRHTVNLDDRDSWRSLNNFIQDLTTSYYTGQVMDWFESKVTFKWGAGFW